MNFVLVLSILLRALATVLAVVLWRRLRDWRISCLALLLAGMTARLAWTTFASGAASQPVSSPGGGWSQTLDAAFVLAISGAAVLTVYWLGRSLTGNAAPLGGADDDARRNLEAALRKPEELLRSVMETAPDVILSLDLEGRIRYANRVVEGLDRDQVLGTSGFDYIPPNQRHQLREAMEAAQTTGKPTEYEVEGDIPGIGRRWYASRLGPVRVRGRVIGFTLCSSDITERKEAEQALQRHAAELEEWKNRYEAAIHATGHIFYEWNTQTNECVWDGSIETTLGYARSRGERPLAWWLSLIHPEDRVAAEAEVHRVVASREPFHLTYRLRRHDGVYIHALDRGQFFQDSAGQTTRMVGFIMDITPLIVTQHALEELNASLHRRVAEQTAKLREKNADLQAFAQTASHDLRAPLRAIAGFGQALTEDYADRLDDAGRQYLRNIVTSAARMDGLISGLLTYSRLGAQELPIQAVPLGAVVREALEPLQSEIQSRGATISIHQPLPCVAGHAATLVQTLYNLLSNAVKFTLPQEPPRVSVRAEMRGETVRLWVEDQGIGVAPKDRERVFRVFERLHGVESFEGAGIGLAIVARSMERLHGRCRVESEPGQGSRFWIELPHARVAESLPSS